jgi:hypothetical protein
MAGLSLHHLTGLPTHDVSNSFKMYTREVLERIPIESDGGFEIGMEILIKAHFSGFRITEVPSLWRDRTAGQSRFKFAQWLPKYLRWYLFALRCRAKAIVSGKRQVAIEGTLVSTPQVRIPPSSPETNAQDDGMRVRRWPVRDARSPSEGRSTQDTRTTATR